MIRETNEGLFPGWSKLSPRQLRKKAHEAIQLQFHLDYSHKLSGDENIRREFGATENDLHILRTVIRVETGVHMDNSQWDSIRTVRDLEDHIVRLHADPDLQRQEEFPREAFDQLAAETAESFREAAELEGEATKQIGLGLQRDLKELRDDGILPS